jgi:hypothetical protein
VYVGLALFFAVGVAAQAVLAGAGIFAGGSWMVAHSVLGHLLTSPIPLIPLLLLIFGFVARVPRRDRWLCALLLVLATIQPVVVYLHGIAPLLSALHPFIALLLFALPLGLAGRARELHAPRPQSSSESL